jgi:hypothetical protein
VVPRAIARARSCTRPLVFGEHGGRFAAAVQRRRKRRCERIAGAGRVHGFDDRRRRQCNLAVAALPARRVTRTQRRDNRDTESFRHARSKAAGVELPNAAAPLVPHEAARRRSRAPPGVS